MGRGDRKSALDDDALALAVRGEVRLKGVAGDDERGRGGPGLGQALVVGHADARHHGADAAVVVDAAGGGDGAAGLGPQAEARLERLEQLALVPRQRDLPGDGDLHRVPARGDVVRLVQVRRGSSHVCLRRRGGEGGRRGRLAAAGGRRRAAGQGVRRGFEDVPVRLLDLVLGGAGPDDLGSDCR